MKQTIFAFLSGLMMLFAVACSSSQTSVTANKQAAQGQWQLPLRAKWNYQLANTPIDPSIQVQVYDIDGFDRSARDVAALHQRGIRVICYIDAGSWENWRPDASQFPKSSIGKPLDNWPGEYWLDIRQISVLAPMLSARMNICKDKGFDAIEFDNVDGYSNDTGFPLTDQDQLKFNIWLAATAHALGLPIGLKNDRDQTAQLVHYFDFAVDEQCFQYQECDALQVFIQAGKPVFEVEYQSDIHAICQKSSAMQFNTIGKQLDLSSPVTQCS